MNPTIPRRARAALALAFLLAPRAGGALQDQPPQEPPAGQPGQPPVLPAPPRTVLRTEQEPITEGKDFYIINFDASPDGVTLEQFIQICQRTTQLNFTWRQDAEQLLKGTKVKLIGTKKIPKNPDRFYAFFQTMLKINDFVCLEVGKPPLQVILLVSLRGTDRNILKQSATYILPDEIERYADKPGALVTALVPLQHLDATRAAQNLRPFFTDPNLENVTTIGNSNSLLLTAFGPTVAALARLLELIDVPAVEPEPAFDIVPLENASASEIEPILRELLERRRTGGGVVVRGEGATAPLTSGGSQEEVKVLTDPRTNSLLVLAPADRMPAVKEMIARLDSPPAAMRESNYRVYFLKNTDAEELETKLKQFLQDTQSAVQQQQSAAGRAGGGAPAVGQQATEQRPVIVAEKISNSLLVSASPTRWEELKRLIDRLDRRQAQVLIETAFVELSEDDAVNLGVELGSAEVPGPNERKPFGFTSFGLSTLEDLDGDGLPDFRTIPSGGATLPGITAGILDGKNFAIPVLLNALRTRTESHVLSIPSVMVNNNESAKVASNDEIPVAQVNQAAGVGQSSGFGGFQSAGITLEISPSISLANYLRLNVHLVVSRFQGSSANANLPPPRTTREVQTSVYLPSGSTMVVGGIIVDSDDRSKSAIPILGDIPILGYLFSSRSDSNSKRTLYFFVTPTILRDEDFADLADISYRRKIDAFETVGEQKVMRIDPNFRPPGPAEEGGGGAGFDAGAFDIPLYRSRPAGEAPREEAAPPPASRPSGEAPPAPEGAEPAPRAPGR
ncbi:MAG TPA: secretin N-terminal domain-containing protein [Planctomycetota bacterium]|nr:secretin N-terminal domain-containing protein [Planctomycetota bacterium]